MGKSSEFMDKTFRDDKITGKYSEDVSATDCRSQSDSIKEVANQKAAQI